jgi:hypothetical protein
VAFQTVSLTKPVRQRARRSSSFPHGRLYSDLWRGAPNGDDVDDELTWHCLTYPHSHIGSPLSWVLQAVLPELRCHSESMI